MANVPANNQPPIHFGNQSRNNAGISNIANRIIGGILPGQTVKVPTDNRQPSARVKALRALPPRDNKGGEL